MNKKKKKIQRKLKRTMNKKASKKNKIKLILSL